MDDFTKLDLRYCLQSFVLQVVCQEVMPSRYDYDAYRRPQSRFTITSSGRQRPGRPVQPDEDYGGDTFDDRNSRLTARSNDRWPNYFRIEAEILRLDNPRGLLEDGRTCDSWNSCDPRVAAYLDV